MLTIEGWGFGAALARTTDFTCKLTGQNYYCTGVRLSVTKTYRDLQTVLRALQAKFGVSAADLIVVDGRVGRSTAQGVDNVAARIIAPGAAFGLNTPLDPEAEPGIPLAGDDIKAAVDRISANAEALLAFFQKVLVNFDALQEAAGPPVRIIEREKIIQLKTRFRPIGAIVIGAGFLTLLGFTANAIYTHGRKTARTREM